MEKVSDETLEKVIGAFGSFMTTKLRLPYEVPDKKTKFLLKLIAQNIYNLFLAVKEDIINFGGLLTIEYVNYMMTKGASLEEIQEIAKASNGNIVTIASHELKEHAKLSTPEISTTINKHIDAITRLIESGKSDPLSSYYYIFTAFLFDNCNMFSGSEDKENILSMVSEVGRENIVDKLIILLMTGKENILQEYKNGFIEYITHLLSLSAEVAISRNNVGVLKRILYTGLSPDASTATGETLLTLAVLANSLESMNALIEKRVDVNKKRQLDGKTPLGVAAYTPHVNREIIEKLLYVYEVDESKRSDLEARDDNGDTPLMAACKNPSNPPERYIAIYILFEQTKIVRSTYIEFSNLPAKKREELARDRAFKEKEVIENGARTTWDACRGAAVVSPPRRRGGITLRQGNRGNIIESMRLKGKNRLNAEAENARRLANSLGAQLIAEQEKQETAKSKKAPKISVLSPEEQLNTKFEQSGVVDSTSTNLIEATIALIRKEGNISKNNAQTFSDISVYMDSILETAHNVMIMNGYTFPEQHTISGSVISFKGVNSKSVHYITRILLMLDRTHPASIKKLIDTVLSNTIEETVNKTRGKIGDIMRELKGKSWITILEALNVEMAAAQNISDFMLNLHITLNKIWGEVVNTVEQDVKLSGSANFVKLNTQIVALLKDIESTTEYLTTIAKVFDFAIKNKLYHLSPRDETNLLIKWENSAGGRRIIRRKKTSKKMGVKKHNRRSSVAK